MRSLSYGNSVRGLTLVELMVVVAVLAILAGIAYPLYTLQTQKARRADAKVALEAIAMAQERAFTVNGSYATSLSSGTLQILPALAAGGSLRGHYALTLSGGGATFSISAAKQGAQSGDTPCSSFEIDNLGRKWSNGQTHDNANCW